MCFVFVLVGMDNSEYRYGNMEIVATVINRYQLTPAWDWGMERLGLRLQTAIWILPSLLTTAYWLTSHYGRDGVSNHQRLGCLLISLIMHRSKKIFKLVCGFHMKTSSWSWNCNRLGDEITSTDWTLYRNASSRSTRIFMVRGPVLSPTYLWRSNPPVMTTNWITTWIAMNRPNLIWINSILANRASLVCAYMSTTVGYNHWNAYSFGITYVELVFTMVYMSRPTFSREVVI